MPETTRSFFLAWYRSGRRSIRVSRRTVDEMDQNSECAVPALIVLPSVCLDGRIGANLRLITKVATIRDPIHGGSTSDDHGRRRFIRALIQENKLIAGFQRFDP